MTKIMAALYKGLIVAGGLAAVLFPAVTLLMLTAGRGIDSTCLRQLGAVLRRR
jgi:hypothetical protein